MALTAGWLRQSEGGSDANSAHVDGVGGKFGVIAPIGSRVVLLPELAADRLHYSESVVSDDVTYTGSATEFDGALALLVGPRLPMAAGAIMLLAGPRITYQLHCAVSVEGGTINYSYSCTGDSSDRFDYGLSLGALATFGHLALEARYELGLRDFDSSGGSATIHTLFLGGGVVF